MAKGLKGITIEIDGNTSPLDKALSKVNSSAKETQKELKGINSLLKLDPSNAELAAQKQMLLAKAVQQTEDKLKLLEQAQKDAAAAGMTINDEAYRNLQREIVLTKSKLEDLKKEQQTFAQLEGGVKKFAKAVGDIANKIPLVKKLGDGFQTVKTKVADAVKNNDKIKAIGTAVDTVKNKVTGLADKVPVIGKVASGFQAVGKAVDAVKGKLPSFSSAMSAAGNAAASAAKGGFTVLSTTVTGTIKAFSAYATAAVTAATAVTKAAVSNYASYEQLVGGVETLFGSSAGIVQDYAANAYKTAGLSANAYMETVTSFSASLLQSLDGDTKAAAEKADMAITDMSDNANKMGTSMESLQTTYAGFAKQNFTMLDNLKLGYGGTKEEMQRLLDDATKLSGIEYDISSYADIVDAIHVVQTEMGITGTTAKEASTTIEGSISAAKGAFSNLMTGLADENADLDALIADVITAAETVVDNVAPRIMQTITSIVSSVPQIISGLSGVVAGVAGELGGVAQTLLPQLTQSFFAIISSIIQILPQLLPQLLTAATDFFMGMLNGLNTVIPQLAAQIPVLITQITTTLTENLPQIIQAGILILVNLIDGITNAIPSLIEAIIALFPVITTALLENLPLIVESGLNLLIALITGIVQAIPQLIAMLPQIITSIVSTLASMLPQIINAGITLLNSLISGIVQAIPQLIAAMPQIISSIINTLIANLPKIISSGIQLIGALISGLIQAIPSLVAAIPQIVKAIFDTFKAVNWADLGSNIISGIKDGVVNAAKNLASAVADAAKSALDAAKEALGIHSPSRVFRDQVGKQMAAGQLIGYEEGMEDNADAFAKASRKSVPTTIDSYINTKTGTTTTESTTAAGGFTQNVTINSPRELSPSETARQMRNQTRQMVLKLRPT